MAFPRKLKELCTPAFIYFIISMIGMTASVFQNIGNRNRYSLGSFSTRVPSTTLVFVVKLIYIFFWTWILNLMCKDGHKEIAWFLVLIPFIMLFVIMGLVMVDPMMEGMDNQTSDGTLKTPEQIEADKKAAALAASNTPMPTIPTTIPQLPTSMSTTMPTTMPTSMPKLP